MKIVFRHQLASKSLRLERDGAFLLFNGEPLDVSAFTEPTPRGQINSPWIAGDLHFEGDCPVIQVKLPHRRETAEIARLYGEVVEPDDGLIVDTDDWDRGDGKI